MTSLRKVAVLAATLLAMQIPAFAEDIDLFAPLPRDITGRPNVLIILDNTGNWNDAFEREKAALVETFNGLPLDAFNVGIMFFGDPDVGYVRAAIRPMDATNRPLYAALIDGLDVSEDRGDARTLARTFSEAHRYLLGLETTSPSKMTSSPHNTKRDYVANPTGGPADVAVHALPDNALDSALATEYNRPFVEDECTDTYIIYIGNTVTSGNVVIDNSSRNSDAGRELAAAGGDTSQISLVYASHQTNYADEWARFLKQELGVITYTVDLDPTPMPGGQSRGMGNSALLASMATVSGGQYFRVDSSADGGARITEALNDIFSRILSNDTAFASVSLPLSVSTQGTYLNQLYVGMFRPDVSARPQWYGNMKQYRLGIVGGSLTTVGVDGTEATNPDDGFIAPCVRSYWGTANSYWSFEPESDCYVGDNATNTRSDSPDGNITKKGAQAQMLRQYLTPAARNTKTCNSFSCPTAPAVLPNFIDANASITAGMLGAADAVERTALIQFGRGVDVNDEDGDVNVAEMRPSVHGDVIHSRPVAINYGTDASPEVVVFYGGNDGVLRAINGNRTSAIHGVAAGQEMWSFVAPEFLPRMKRLYENSPKVDFANLTVPEDEDADPSNDPQKKDYGLDGPITAYRNAMTSTTWIYSSARRGGRVMYAFDVSRMAGVSDPADLEDPKLLWKVGCPNLDDDTGCMAGFSGIGQTWSVPKVMKTAGYGSGTTPMVIFGGGYDDCEDGDPNTCSASSKGRNVYVLDAADGTKLAEFATDRPVAADVFIVPDPLSGIAKFAYVVDLGGNIYRIAGSSPNAPFGLDAPATWTITKIASLGCATPSTACAANRKFMFVPDVVEPPSPGSGVYHLLVGSGDREKPLRDVFDDAFGVENYFFMVKDVPTNPDWLTSETARCGDSVICMASLTPITTSADPAESDLATSKGWYLGLIEGEQVVTSAITVFGTVTFSTHEPFDPEDATACAPTIGTARVYNIGYLDAHSRNGSYNRFEVVSGGGLPPSPVAGLVKLDASSDPIPFIIGADWASPLRGREPLPPALTTQPKSLTYWYLQQ